MSTASMGRLSPAENAVELVSHMLDAADVNQTVLEETLSSALDGRIRESGRTACGSVGNIRLPLGRFSSSVELSACPVTDETGVWHTHVTRQQFLNPEHSLPDVANVLFEPVSASVIVGAETSHVMMAPADRESARETFRDTLGLSVVSPHDVVKAIQARRIPNPGDARSRVFGRLSALFERRQTSLTDRAVIMDNIHAVPPMMSSIDGHDVVYELIECAQPGGAPGLEVAGSRLNEHLRNASEGLQMLSKELSARALDEAIGTLAAAIISDRLFHPAQTIRQTNPYRRQ